MALEQPAEASAHALLAQLGQPGSRDACRRSASSHTFGVQQKTAFSRAQLGLELVEARSGFSTRVRVPGALPSCLGSTVRDDDSKGRRLRHGRASSSAGAPDRKGFEAWTRGQTVAEIRSQWAGGAERLCARGEHAPQGAWARHQRAARRLLGAQRAV